MSRAIPSRSNNFSPQPIEVEVEVEQYISRQRAAVQVGTSK
jgi:hypothetical protein